jgi:hypothetical protein
VENESQSKRQTKVLKTAQKAAKFDLAGALGVAKLKPIISFAQKRITGTLEEGWNVGPQASTGPAVVPSIHTA